MQRPATGKAAKCKVAALGLPVLSVLSYFLDPVDTFPQEVSTLLPCSIGGIRRGAAGGFPTSFLGRKPLWLLVLF